MRLNFLLGRSWKVELFHHTPFGMQHTRGRSRRERKMQRSLVRPSDVDGDRHGVLATAEEHTTDRADVLEIAAVGNRDVLG